MEIGVVQIEFRLILLGTQDVKNVTGIMTFAILIALFWNKMSGKQIIILRYNLCLSMPFSLSHVVNRATSQSRSRSGLHLSDLIGLAWIISSESIKGRKKPLGQFFRISLKVINQLYVSIFSVIVQMLIPSSLVDTFIFTHSTISWSLRPRLFNPMCNSEKCIWKCL
jgi:hypothetical protein